MRPVGHVARVREGERRARGGIEPLVLRIPHQDRGCLRAGQGVLRAEGALVIALHDAGALCPGDGGGVPRVRGDVGEAAARDGGSALEVIEDLHHLRAGQIRVRGELGPGHAGHDAVGEDIAHRVEIPGVGRHIRERETGAGLSAGEAGAAGLIRRLLSAGASRLIRGLLSARAAGLSAGETGLAALSAAGDRRRGQGLRAGHI